MIRGALMRKTIIVVAAVVAFTASCSSTTGTSAGTTTTPSETTTETPTQPAASVQQYASLVAEQRADFEKSASQLADCFGEDNDPPLCFAYALTAEMQADTLQIVLRGANNPESKKYLGPPPAEISGLVDETTGAAVAVVKTYNDWSALDCPGKDTCAAAFFQFSSAVSKLKGKIDGWAPYL